MPGSGEFGTSLPRALVEHTLDVISVLSPDGTILYESPSVLRWTGWRPEELQGRNGFELVHPDDLPQVLAAIVALTGPAGQATTTFRFKAKDGSWRWIEALGTDRLKDPQINGIVLSSRDVTDRRQLDDQLRHAQRMDAIGRLAGGVAHDFNNLLTAILGYGSLLEARLGPDDDAARDAAREIRRAAERAAALTRQLLSFSRRVPASARLVRIDPLVSDLERMLHRLIGEETELVTRLDARPGRVLIDPGQLEQVVVNLVVNARDAMPQGGTLTISTSMRQLGEAEARSCLLQPGNWVQLNVVDSGTGMDETVRNRLFEPFFTTKAPGQGTGLGLSVIWGIVRDAGGTVLVDSTLGRGSTFTVLLPAGDIGPEQTPAGHPTALPQARGETVLLVEDEPAVRDLLNKAFSKAGWQVLVAVDGEDALAVAAAHPGRIDILVSDVIMPRMGGVVLARSLRRLRPALRVLFITGYADTELSDEEVLPKPFTPSLVLAKARAMLGHTD